MQINNINDLSINKLALKQVFDSLVTFEDFIDVKYYSNCFCLFHDDKNKPSAKFFKDEKTGIIRQWCWSCRKQYTAYHYVKSILEQDPLFYLIKEFGLDFLSNYITTFDFTLDNIKSFDINLIKDKNINDLVDYISGIKE